MLIGEVARAAGVTTQTLRYYERRGLLRPAGRSRSGYRRYDPSAVAAVGRIKAAQRLGFTLAEIVEIAASARGPLTGAEIRATAARKLEVIRDRVAALRTTEHRILELLHTCGCGADRLCAFLPDRGRGGLAK